LKNIFINLPINIRISVDFNFDLVTLHMIAITTANAFQSVAVAIGFLFDKPFL
jgi:hypothetical protein